MSEQLEIAFFGSSLVSAYWNGAATYYRGIVRALHELGHRVTFFEPDAFDRQAHRDIGDPDWARVVVYPATSERDVRNALAQAGDADVLIKASGVGVFDELLEREVLAHRRQDALVVFWDVDAPATLERTINNPVDPFRELIPQYDLIFTYGGGAPVVKAYGELGARECVPIYNALDPTTHFPVKRDPRYAVDLAFVANRLPDREARVEEFFLNVAARMPDSLFLLGGNGWHEKRMSSNVRYIGHVYTHQHNVINSSPLMVLNVNRQSMANFGYSPPTRVFEAAGAGACLITDEWPGIDMFLQRDREILAARDGDDVRRYLREIPPGRTRRIGKAARRRLLAEHTYAHRAARVSEILLSRSVAPLAESVPSP